MGQVQKSTLDLKIFLFRFCWENYNYKPWLQRIANSRVSSNVTDIFLCKIAPDKKKMNPRDQRKYAASKPRHSFKNLPEGWTREKVARAYETAPLRGIPKSTWLEKWAEKYDFPLCRWKVRRWVKKCIKSDANEERDSEESSYESD